MNILITCAGRRNYVIDYFRQALIGKGKVYAVNSSLDATSMIVADGAFIAPPIYEKEYIDFLLNICNKYSIKLIISLFDLELPILAQHRVKFENKGIVLAISSFEAIEICNDKYKTLSFTKKFDIPCISTYIDLEYVKRDLELGAINFPLYVKPRWGMGSISTQIANNLEELKILFSKVKEGIEKSYLKHYPGIILDKSIIVQEFANGTEYGLDVINDFNGNYITTFVKRKLGMRSGETDGAITVDVPELISLGEKIGRALKHIGNLDVDVFWDGQITTLLEMNARIGGGYPFSHLAGANLPRAYIDWAQGKQTSTEYLQVKVGVKGFKGITILNSARITTLR